MSALWGVFLEVFQVGLFGLTHFYGGHLASAIVSFALIARIGLLPLTVRMSLRARRHARRLKALAPELARVRERWKDDRRRLALETMAVYERRGVGPLDGGVLKGSLVQAPVFIGLYHAIRDALASRSAEQGFLWVSNLARPDVGVAVIASALAGLGSWAGASESQPAWALAVPAVGSAAMALMISAGFGLYLAASGAVATLQGLMVRRIERREASA